VVIKPVLTPRDNFAGRSKTRFGVAEFVDLSFTATPPTGARDLGDLRWFIASGGGALAPKPGNVGTALYTAGLTAGDVTLVLKVVSGPKAGATVATETITVVAPTGAVMKQVPGTHIWHDQGTWSVGFLGNIFLQPTDVSFRNIEFLQGACHAAAKGYLTHADPQVHALGLRVKVGVGNATKGTQVMCTDTVSTGHPLHPPYGDGDFKWAIPFRYGGPIPSPGKPPTIEFTKANHHATADASGTGTIEKQGAGPFTRKATDATSGYHVGEITYDPDGFASGKAAVDTYIGDALDAMGITDPDARDNWETGPITAAFRESSYNSPRFRLI
jgi:hypothetical protein